MIKSRIKSKIPIKKRFRVLKREVSQKTKNLIFNRNDDHILKWLLTCFGVDSSLLDLSRDYMSFLNHICQHKGKMTAVKINKDLRLCVLRYFSEPLPNGFGSFKIKLTYDGLPVKLAALIKIIRGRDVNNLRWILTLMTITRRIEGLGFGDTRSITDPSIVEYDNSIVSEADFKSFLRHLSLKKRGRALFDKNRRLIRPKFQEYHLTSKTGPTSQQALYSCLDDLENLPESLLSNISYLGGDDLSKKMSILHQNISLFREKFYQPKVSNSKTFRKISFLPDKEGKTRTIAILDYWSQTVLKPLHDLIFKMLKLIPQDNTFYQDRGLEDLHFNNERTYYCFDLSNATDRFPIKLQFGFLEVAFGLDFAVAWRDIMVGYPFEVKRPSGPNKHIYYEVGNPMGSYSSFGIFSLCHHLILFSCCRELRLNFTRAEYKMVGDDIVIWNDALAKRYKDKILSLGIEISSFKTHKSNQFIEFIKRYFIPEGEISPLSVEGIRNNSKSYLSFLTYLEHYSNRSYMFSKSLKAILEHYYLSVHKQWSRKRKLRAVRLVGDSYYLYKYLRGYIDVLTLMKNVSITSSMSLSCNHSSLCEGLMNSTIVQLFESSSSKFLGDHKDRVFDFILWSTADKETEDYPYAHPITFIQGKYLEEAYLKSMGRAYELDTSGEGIWNPFFRVLVVTDINALLHKSNHTVLTSSAPLLLKGLKQSIEMLNAYPW